MALIAETAKKRRNLNKEGYSLGRGRNAGRPRTASQFHSRPFTSSNALISVGPYTFVVRQPGTVELPGNAESAASSCKRRHPHSDEDRVHYRGVKELQKREMSETEEEVETPLWISPVGAQRPGGDAALRSIAALPDVPISPPQPYYPQPVHSMEKINLSTDDVEEKLSTPLPLQREPQAYRQHCASGPTGPSTALLTEVLRRMRRRLLTTGRRIPLIHECSSHAKGNAPKTSNYDTSPPPPPPPPQQQHRSPCLCSSHSASQLYADIDVHQSVSSRRAARQRRNEALGYVGVSKQGEEGLFTESDASPAGRLSRSNHRSLDTLEWGDRLWRGIEDDEERMCRWLVERGMLPDENSLALRILTDYLKSKTERLERDYDELFWLSRQGSPKLRHFQQAEFSTMASGSSNIPTQHQQQLEHPYGGPSEARVGSLQQRSMHSPEYTPKERHVCVSPWSSGGKDTRGVTGAAPIPHDKGNNTVSPLTPRTEQPPFQRHQSRCVTRDLSSFYTGRSMATGECRNVSGSRVAGRKVCESASTSSRSGRVTLSDDSHNATKNTATPPLPLQQRPEPHVQQNTGDTDKKERHDGVRQDPTVPAPGSSQLPVDPQPPPGALIHPIASHSTADVADLTTVLRLREYCSRLETERLRILRESATPRKRRGANGDGLGTVVPTAKKREAGREHSTIPPRVPSVPLQPIPTLRAPCVTETLSDTHASVDLSVSAVSHSSSKDRDTPSVMNRDEKKVCSGQRDAEALYMDVVAVPPAGNTARPNTFALPSPLRSTASRTENRSCNSAPHTPPRPPPVPLVSSKYISPMPNEPRTVLLHGAAEEMWRARSLATSRMSSTNQSLQHVPPSPLASSWNDAASHDGAIVLPDDLLNHPSRSRVDAFLTPARRLEANGENASQVWRPNSSHSFSGVSDKAIVAGAGRTDESHIFKKDLEAASRVGAHTPTPDCPSSPHPNVQPLSSSTYPEKEPQRKEEPTIVKGSSFFPLRNVVVPDSPHSCHTPLRKKADQGRNREPGSVVYSSSSSSSSSSNSGPNFQGTSGRSKRRQQEPHGQKGRRRFAAVNDAAVSVSTTPLPKLRRSSWLIDMNSSRHTGSRSSSRTAGGEKERGEVVAGLQGGSAKSTPRKNTGGFIVRVMNNGGDMIERREGKSHPMHGVSSGSRRFGLLGSRH